MAADSGRDDRDLAIFLTGVLVVAVGYTVMAFGMDWRTVAGRIGPGFFPRLVGLGIIGCAGISLVRVLTKAPEPMILQKRKTSFSPSARSRPGGGQPGTYPGTVCAVVAVGAAFTVVLLPLGAVLASALFLFATLALLNPGRYLRNAVLSVTVPAALYLLLQTLLNAGLPAGVLSAVM